MWALRAFPLLLLPGSIPAEQPASLPATPPTSAPMTLGSLTTQVIGALHEDGTTDAEEVQALVRSINQQVVARGLLGPDRVSEGATAAGTAPFAEGGWRLWVFWAADSPDQAGLARALVQVRGAGVATIRPVHLCSLRHWERWMGRMEQYREAAVAAARAQDQDRCLAVFAAWKAEVAPFDAMVASFYHRGVGLMSPTTAAQLLQVEQVPCFRLLSPTRHVHALEGFGDGFDLVAWIRTCQDWEAAHPPRSAP